MDWIMVLKANHPCPLLEGRRGTVPVCCLKRRRTRCDTFLVDGADRYGSPPFCKEGPGVVLSQSGFIYLMITLRTVRVPSWVTTRKYMPSG